LFALLAAVADQSDFQNDCIGEDWPAGLGACTVQASKNRSYQESGINGSGLDRCATFAKVQATMMGIVADPRGDAN
jgi:hypothetical protein